MFMGKWKLALRYPEYVKLIKVCQSECQLPLA